MNSINGEDRPAIYAKEEGDLIIVRMGGVINSQTLPEVRELVDQLIKNHDILTRKNLSILIDYKDVKDIDSATIANILDRLSEHKKRNHTLAFVNVPEEFKSLITIHKLQDEVMIFDSEKKALKALKKPIQ